MHDAGELIVTDSFNGLLSRMAGIDHLGILMEGHKILKRAKRQETEPAMRMSEITKLTGMTREDLEFFISCRLIEVIEDADEQVISFREVIGLVRIFFRLEDKKSHVGTTENRILDNAFDVLDAPLQRVLPQLNCRDDLMTKRSSGCCTI